MPNVIWRIEDSAGIALAGSSTHTSNFQILTDGTRVNAVRLGTYVFRAGRIARLRIDALWGSYDIGEPEKVFSALNVDLYDMIQFPPGSMRLIP